ncbi:hypothetical protein JW960_25075 [candidate division KSB1 bacterium]|nr:hypothetical protein [candidate division KSB1 bacterium]
MVNPYKRSDVFACRYEGHAKFNNRVSAYHVLRVKQCYPDGCLAFKWRCELLNKGKTCPKRFKHVGRKCFGCKHFYDEKINHQPQLLIGQDDYQNFLDELEEFEEWIESIKGRPVEFWGMVSSVKPRITKVITSDKSTLSLEGYFLHFNDAYFNEVHWEDHCWAILYADQQQRYQFASGDDVEFRCHAGMDKGRLIVTKIRNVEFRQKSQRSTWTNSQTLVAKGAFTAFNEQPAKCLHCDQGVLVDVVDKSNPTWQRKRELFCLRSYPDPAVCGYAAEKLLDEADMDVAHEDNC